MTLPTFVVIGAMKAGTVSLRQVSAGRERRRAEVALLDDRYLGPSRYGFQLAAFLDHFDHSQVLVIASEVAT